jgi:hypothetical protein
MAVAKRLVVEAEPEKREVVVAFVAIKFVAERMEAKKEVEVALLEVLLTAVKFCKVEDPVRRRFESVVSPVMLAVPPTASGPET